MRRGLTVGIRQVAARLDLSVCTVSRILNDRMDNAKYRPATIARVRRAAQKMGYQPDLVARALVQGKTWLIGLCVADITNPVFSEFASGFERLAARRGYSTLICNAGEDPDVERQYLKTLMAHRVDAIVISPLSRKNIDLLKRIREGRCRVILFDRTVRGDQFNGVFVDNRGAMAGLARRCLNLGHRKFGVLPGNPMDSSLQLRLAGVRDALRAARLDPRRALFVAPSAAATSLEAGAAGMREILAQAVRPTITISLANVLSMGALKTLRQAEIVLGASFSFASFDDFYEAEINRPAITAIAQPIAAMAQACVALALAPKRDRIIRRCLPCKLCWRKSVGPAP